MNYGVMWKCTKCKHVCPSSGLGKDYFCKECGSSDLSIVRSPFVLPRAINMPKSGSVS